MDRLRKKESETNKTSVDVVFEQHKSEKKVRKFLTNKLKLFILGILVGFVLIVIFYFLSGFSKVKGIQIEGNYFLNKQQVLELSGLDNDSRYLLVFDSMIEAKIETSPFVEEASVTVKGDGTVYIKIVEKKIIGYQFVRYPELIFSDNSSLEMADEHMYLLSKIPLIIGFDESLEGLCKAFLNVDQARIELISEIHRFEYSYDSNGIELVLKDGNRFFASFYSIDVVNQYNSIASLISEKNVCLYAEEITKKVYQSVCPEEIQEEISEENEENTEENKENPDE